MARLQLTDDRYIGVGILSLGYLGLVVSAWSSSEGLAVVSALAIALGTDLRSGPSPWLSRGTWTGAVVLTLGLTGLSLSSGPIHPADTYNTWNLPYWTTTSLGLLTVSTATMVEAFGSQRRFRWSTALSFGLAAVWFGVLLWTSIEFAKPAASLPLAHLAYLPRGVRQLNSIAGLGALATLPVAAAFNLTLLAKSPYERAFAATVDWLETHGFERGRLASIIYLSGRAWQIEFWPERQDIIATTVLDTWPGFSATARGDGRLERTRSTNLVLDTILDTEGDPLAINHALLKAPALVELLVEAPGSMLLGRQLTLKMDAKRLARQNAQTWLNLAVNAANEVAALSTPGLDKPNLRKPPNREETQES